MESWVIPTVAVLVSVASLWWKVTKDITGIVAKMATKDDISDLKDEIREIRQMLFSHVSNSHTHD